jgi:Uma2 family endonuclease
MALRGPGRAENIEHKIDVYLRSGTALVVVVDPIARTVRTVDSSDDALLRGDAVLTHAALPHFALSLAELFAELDT